MLTEGNFDRLGEFNAETSWESMSSTERDLLAFLFVAQGATQLSQGNKEALESFRKASLLAPENANMFYRQAIAFSLQGSNMQCLIGACKAFHLTTELKPDFFEAWYMWGTILIRRGACLQEAIYLEEAHQKFCEAKIHSHSVSESKIADLYGQWGLCWQMHGKLSGEACDFHQALEHYRLAADHGLHHVAFLNDYADATAELAALIGSKDLLLESVKLYQQALQIAPDNFNTWFHAGFCFQRLFDSTRDEQFFFSAHESYTHASELDPSCGVLWLNWGALFADAAKEKRDPELFQMSFEKFAKADACEKNHPDVLSRWGEALGLCGAYSDRVDLMREAEAKIVRSLEIEPENADTWFVYGACLSEIGRYFSDAQYYRQAIEKLQYGLSLNAQHPMILHTLALAHFAIGELLTDEEMIRKSVDYFARIVECTHGRAPPEFWNDWGVSLMKLSELTSEQSSVESAIEKFDRAIGDQSLDPENSSADPEWLYNYACAYDFLGDYTEEPRHHEKAILVLTNLIQHDPSANHVRYNLALALSHLGEMIDDYECFQKANDQFQILLQQDSEDGQAWNDWGLTLLNFAELLHESTHPEKSRALYEQSESKFLHSIALGFTQAYYNLACLYSLTENYAGAMHYLERSESAGSLPIVDDILNDGWLEGLRSTQHFKHFLAQLSRKNNHQ